MSVMFVISTFRLWRSPMSCDVLQSNTRMAAFFCVMKRSPYDLRSPVQPLQTQGGWMGGWMVDGRMDEWTDGWVDGWQVGQMNGRQRPL